MPTHHISTNTLIPSSILVSHLMQENDRKLIYKANIIYSVRFAVLRDCRQQGISFLLLFPIFLRKTPIRHETIALALSLCLNLFSIHYFFVSNLYTLIKNKYHVSAWVLIKFQFYLYRYGKSPKQIIHFNTGESPDLYIYRMQERLGTLRSGSHT